MPSALCLALLGLLATAGVALGVRAGPGPGPGASARPAATMPAAASRPVTSQPATGTATRPSPRALRAKITAARVDISNIETCLKVFEVDCGRFPTTGEGLLALVQQPGAMKGWSGPYLEKGVPKDPWGTAYQYLCPGPHNNKGFDLWSHGPDQKDGGGDDIDNWSDK